MSPVARQIKKIKALLSKEQTKILETALWLMMPALLTKVTGQVFNLAAASYFGADSPSFNRFLVANAIPELMATVLMVGSLGVVVIPVLEAAKAQDTRKRFFEIYSSILNLALLVFAVFAVLMIIFASTLIPFAIELVNPNEVPTDEELNIISNMMRVLILPQLILGLSVFIGTGLNVFDRYIVPQLSGLFYNIGRLASLVFFILILLPRFPGLEENLHWVLVAGVIFGSVLHLMIQLPLFLTLNFEYKPIIDFKSKYIREILVLGLPRLLVLASDQIGIAVNRFLAFAFTGGASAFYFGFSIYLVIPSLFGYTFSYASYPTLSRLFIKKDYEKIVHIVNKTLNEIFFLALPFVVTLMVLRVPVVRLIYGIVPGTNFEFSATYQVAWVLLWFTFGMVFITARWFLLNLYYASKDTITPSIVSVFSLISVISLSILFTNLFSHNPTFAISDIQLSADNFLERSTSRAGVGGISLAMSVTYTVEFMVLLFIFNARKVNIGLKELLLTLGRKFVAAGVMLVFMYLIYKTWNTLSYALPDAASELYRGSTTINLIILTLVTVIPSFILYYSLCMLFRVEELRILRKYLNPLFKLGGLSIK